MYGLFQGVNLPSFLIVGTNVCKMKKKEGTENKCEFYAFLHIMIMSVIV